MYKLYKDTEGSISSVAFIQKNMSIPFDPANTDYANFKTDITEGAELLDADGNTMSPEQVAEFVATLP